MVAAGAVRVTLGRPTTWLVALAGFLAGGGVVLLAWPILVLPTPAGLQNLLGAPVSELVFGGPSPALVALAALVAGVAIVVLAAGLLTGAWAERRGIALVVEGAAGDGLVALPPLRGRASGVAAAAMVRLLGLVPPVVAGSVALPTVYGVAYRQLTLPDDLAAPLPLRVIGEIPGLLAVLALVWLLADAAAAVGVRRLVLEGRRPLAAWALGWADLVRRPHRILAVSALGDVALIATAGPALLAAAIAWARLREALGAEAGSPLGVVAVMAWVAVWLGAVALAGLGAALRAALLTLEGARRP